MTDIKPSLIPSISTTAKERQLRSRAVTQIHEPNDSYYVAAVSSRDSTSLSPSPPSKRTRQVTSINSHNATGTQVNVLLPAGATIIDDNESTNSFDINELLTNDTEDSVMEGAPNEEKGNPSSYYTCNQCNKFFWTESSMRHHYSLYHSEKAFICEICRKAFRFRSNLAEHRSVHTALKPYVCKYCGKSSRLKGNLTKHILKHHKMETNAIVGKEDIIIKKGKKSVKDPKCIDFLEKSMIVLTQPRNNVSVISSSASHARRNSGTQRFRNGPGTTNTRCRLSNSATNGLRLTITNGSNDTSDLPICIPNSLIIDENGEQEIDFEQSSADSPFPNSESNNKVSDSIDSLIAKACSSNKDRSSIQNSVDAIIESAFVTTSGVMERDAHLSMKNCIPATTLLESALRANGGLQLAESPNLDRSICGEPSSLRALLADFTAPVTLSSPISSHLESIDSPLPWPALMTITPSRESPTSNHTAVNMPSVVGNNSTTSSTQCAMCGKHFRKASNLELHMQLKHLALVVESNSMVQQGQNEASQFLKSILSPIPNENHSEQQALMRNSPSLLSNATCGQIATSIPPISNKLWSQATKSVSPPSLVSQDHMTVTPGGPRGLSHNKQTLPVSPQTTATVNLNCFTEKLSALNGCHKDIREIREMLAVLKELCVISSPKVENLLLSLDSRVSRVERQMEASLSTLGTLIQVQTSLNLALCQFKDEITQKVTAIVQQLKSNVSGVPAASEIVDDKCILDRVC